MIFGVRRFAISALALGLACGVACKPNTSGVGSDGPELGAASSSGTSMGAITTPVSVDDTAGTFGVPPATGTSSDDPPESSGTTASDSTGDEGSTGGDPLIDHGLLARWYVDEAEAGQPPISLADSVFPPLDLPLLYGAGSPEFASENDNLGLLWYAVEEDGRAQAPIQGTKIETGLAEHTRATFEIVFALQAVSGSTSRLLHIGTESNSGDFAIGSDSLDSVEIRWAGSQLMRFEATLGESRQVLHVVVDTDQPEVGDRIRAFLDGIEIDAEEEVGPAMGEGIPLLETSWLILGNRSDGQRSFRGSLQYAAIYDEPFSLAEVVTNATLLEANDDEI